jgi:DNA-binding HxlR family transcriptional regulator
MQVIVDRSLAKGKCYSRRVARRRRVSRSPRRSDCPLNIALEMLGDRWSLLIVRDILFKGFRTFKEFLTAGEGIASNILTDRLRRLEADGILARGAGDDGRVVVYRLTEKGLDLAPALVEIILWSDRHEDTAAPPATIREMHADRDAYVAALRRRAGS